MLCIGPFLFFASQPFTLYLSGDILDAAPSEFLRALRLAPKADLLVLNSQGGYIDPALLIAREVRKRGLKTYVAPNAQCNSACAYIFLAGAERKVDGKLGVHQLANSSNDAVSAQQTFADVFVAMREFGVADGVMSLMLTTPPNIMHFFSTEELASYAIETGDPLAVPVLKADDPLPPEGSASSALADVAALNPEGTQALLLEASDDGKTGAVPFSGTVEWRRGVDDAGAPTIAATATIPARNISVELLIRRNDDLAIPGPVLIEVNFRLSDSFPGGSVAGLPGVLLKNEELVQGAPLMGSSKRVVSNSFLFALAASSEDRAANNQLLTSRKWIDLALIYATGKRAIVTLEKDAAAEAMFIDVFSAWGT